MGNELIWTPANSAVRILLTFHDFLDKVRELDNSNPDLWVKWKDYENQIVVRTDKYFYKLYVTDKDSGVFQSIVRETLGEIYRTLGITWNVHTINSLDAVYTIEQRQCLEVCKSVDFQQLLLNWGKLLTILEHQLGFDLLLKQVQEYFPEVKHIKLVRDCVLSPEDYAIHNGQVILLDDADFFLCLLDSQYNVLSFKFNSIFINMLGENMLFAPLEYGNGTLKSNEQIDKWWLFPEDAGNGKSLIDFQSARADMINTSAKLLASMKELPMNESTKLVLKTKVIGYEG